MYIVSILRKEFMHGSLCDMCFTSSSSRCRDLVLRMEAFDLFPS
jgi:hypothetical protein